MNTPRIAVIGAGPAGSACAYMLQRKGMSVEVWETRTLPRCRFPEVLNAQGESILSRLQLDAFLKSEGKPCPGVLRKWNGPETEKEQYRKPGWRIERSALDWWLRNEVRDTGVRWIRDRLRSFRQGDCGWILRGEKTKGRADYLIDATGRAALVSRRLGVHSSEGNRTIAIGVAFPLPKEESPFLRVERVASGWWYFVDFNETTTAVFVTEQRTRKARSKGTLLQALGVSSWAAEARECHGRWTSLKSFDATPRARIAAGRNWLAIGDAASAFDPISSQGLISAFSSAWFGSQALLDYAGGENDALQIYAAAVYLTWDRTLRLQDQVYGDGTQL